MTDKALEVLKFALDNARESLKTAEEGYRRSSRELLQDMECYAERKTKRKAEIASLEAAIAKIEGGAE